MTDRELLELAAKAAGIDVIRSRLHDPLQRDMLVKNSVRNSEHLAGQWNPLTDDGDALRLAVKLLFRVDVDKSACVVSYAWKIQKKEECGTDPYAATRRAIVHAAAEIGKQCST
jgi:hypothetical protein